MQPLFPDLSLNTPEKDLNFLFLQIKVGEAIRANPAIVEYIEWQVASLIGTVTSLNSGSPEGVKDITLRQNNQIAVYKHLHELAEKLEEMKSSYDTNRQFLSR